MWKLKQIETVKVEREERQRERLNNGYADTEQHSGLNIVHNKE